MTDRKLSPAWARLTPAERLAKARVIREREYQKWLRGDVFTSHLRGWDDWIKQLEQEAEA